MIREDLLFYSEDPLFFVSTLPIFFESSLSFKEDLLFLKNNSRSSEDDLLKTEDNRLKNIVYPLKKGDPLF